MLYHRPADIFFYTGIHHFTIKALQF
uniref:Uncharacterized protein n=1 Tax=Anguilla anguilla TaxID=7936 RepID=A0A0E9RHK9_ANGAN